MQDNIYYELPSAAVTFLCDAAKKDCCHFAQGPKVNIAFVMEQHIFDTNARKQLS